MTMRLVVVSGPDKGQAYPLTPDQSLTLGRSQEAGITLSDPYASRVHAALEVGANSVLLKDQGSAGGTYVNGERVPEATLSHGDTIRVGESELRFEDTAGGSTQTLVTPAERPARATPASEDDLAQLVGQKLHRYDIRKEIARGQSGMVFLAEETEKNRRIALKVLWPEISKNEEEMQRFIRAMKTMLPIEHENLVRIHNAGKHGRFCWVAMEYVDGEPLTTIIARIGTLNMLDWRYAYRVAVHLARGLEAAYEHQVIHRNITPQNVLIRDSDKAAKLGDMMLAKALEGALASDITRPGQLIGDAPYMSPERTQGAGGVDCRSDIYSLGTLLYALLTGHPPHAAGSLPELILKIRRDKPEPPTKFQLSIPGLFEGAVLRMLEKRPEDRFQTPSALLKDLDRIGTFENVSA